jgi:hypothetical protein
VIAERFVCTVFERLYGFEAGPVEAIADLKVAEGVLVECLFRRPGKHAQPTQHLPKAVEAGHRENPDTAGAEDARRFREGSVGTALKVLADTWGIERVVGTIPYLGQVSDVTNPERNPREAHAEPRDHLRSEVNPFCLVASRVSRNREPAEAAARLKHARA